MSPMPSTSFDFHHNSRYSLFYVSGPPLLPVFLVTTQYVQPDRDSSLSAFESRSGLLATRS